MCCALAFPTTQGLSLLAPASLSPASPACAPSHCNSLPDSAYPLTHPIGPTSLFNTRNDDDDDDSNGVEQQPRKSQKAIKEQIQKVIRQIVGSVTFLPLLDEPCSFDLLVYTGNDVRKTAKRACLLFLCGGFFFPFFASLRCRAGVKPTNACRLHALLTMRHEYFTWSMRLFSGSASKPRRRVKTCVFISLLRCPCRNLRKRGSRRRNARNGEAGGAWHALKAYVLYM